MLKLIHDTRLLFVRNMLVSLRTPVWIMLGLFQPILYLLLFAPLLKGLEGSPGFASDNALNVFSPGLVVLTAMYSAAFVGFGLLEDLRAGIVERLRVTPASRLALLLGPVLRDVTILLGQSALLLVTATVMGLRANFLGLALLFGLMALIGMMMASVSYAIALTVRDENSLAATLNTLLLPMMLLSGIMLPLTLAPSIIRTLAKLNPFSYAVDAARALVNGDLGSSAALGGFAVIAALTALAVFWAARAFRQAAA